MSNITPAIESSIELASQKAAKRLSWRRVPFFGLTIVILFLIIVIFGKWIAPYSYEHWDLLTSNMPPTWVEGGSWDHLFGTDQLGRDVLSRIIHGARFSLAIALACLIIYTSIGLALGLLSGFMGGKVDLVIMRICDLWMGFPNIILALVLVSVMGPSAKTVILAVGISHWPHIARMMRGECLNIAQNDYIRLARVAGCSNLRIIVSHIFPNLVNLLIILVTIEIGGIILLTAGMSFLGLGTQPPSPDWGLMINEGRPYITSEWWLVVAPAFAILLVVLGFNLIGDWLRDVLDPKQRVR